MVVALQGWTTTPFSRNWYCFVAAPPVPAAVKMTSLPTSTGLAMSGTSVSAVVGDGMRTV